MPWNDNSSNNGPWGGGQGGKNPWGDRPRGSNGGGRGPQGPGGGPGGEPPDLEELVRRLQTRFGGVFGGGGGGGRGGSGSGGGFGLIVLILAIGLAAWVLWPGSGYYIVQANEQGVVLRFGKVDRITPSGFHLKLPYPIETAETPPTERNELTQIGSTSSEALMLTGDENIVNLVFTVQWEVGNDPGEVFDFLFRIDDPRRTLESVAESAMREVIGRTDLQPILRNDESIKREVQVILQDTLDQYQAGIDVLNVVINRPTLPTLAVEVDALDEFSRPIELPNGERQKTTVSPEAAFLDVRNARSEAARLVEDATAYANSVVPEARGDAARVRAAANAYADAVVREARGEAARFTFIYEQYAATAESRASLRIQLHREAIESVLERAQLIILDSNAGSGAVPYLPLNQLRRPDAPAQ